MFCLVSDKRHIEITKLNTIISVEQSMQRHNQRRKCEPQQPRTRSAAFSPEPWSVLCPAPYISPHTCVVAVIERTKVGTVEQLKLSKRPWEGKRDEMSCCLSLRFSNTGKKDFTPSALHLERKNYSFRSGLQVSTLQIWVKAEISQGQETVYVLSKREVFLSASLLGDRQLGKHTSIGRQDSEEHRS